MLLNVVQFLAILPIALNNELVSSDKRIKRLSSPNFDQEIIGSMAKYCVSIRSRTPHKYFGDNHFCGGSIISDIFVLTAAHCVMDKRKIMHRPRVLLIVAGTPNRLKLLEHSVNAPVVQIFVPANFTVLNTNNIALIQLKEKLPMDNAHIGIINLPSRAPTYGISYRVLGWGRVFKGGPLASRILYVDVMLLDSDFCCTRLESFSEEMLCAGNLNNNLDENPCTGDTGGPFIKDYTVYGVATYGLGCGVIGMPSVYTNVWHHIDWINDIMDRNGSQKYSCLYLFILYLLNVLTIEF